MLISLIAAMAENRVIGRGGRMPWHIPSDLRRFRRITMGHPVILGRLTYESIGRPFDGRTNIIVTSRRDYRVQGAVVVPTLHDALAACGGADEAFICGGETIFREAMPLADRIYLTLVHGEYEGDAFFPEVPKDFVEVQREEVDETIPYRFVVYERRK
jgi:dihydrofolate reductase